MSNCKYTVFQYNTLIYVDMLIGVEKSRTGGDEGSGEGPTHE